MSTSPESLSLKLIEDMEQLEAAVTASFAKTDALLAQLGLSRDVLGPIVREGKKRLSMTDRITLEKQERDWRYTLEASLETQFNKSETDQPKRKNTRVSIGLCNRI